VRNSSYDVSLSCEYVVICLHVHVESSRPRMHARTSTFTCSHSLTTPQPHSRALLFYAYANTNTPIHTPGTTTFTCWRPPTTPQPHTGAGSSTSQHQRKLHACLEERGACGANRPTETSSTCGCGHVQLRWRKPCGRGLVATRRRRCPDCFVSGAE
jgi:hypothetical protein